MTTMMMMRRIKRRLWMTKKMKKKGLKRESKSWLTPMQECSS
jgi:hypothetical protein